MADATASSAVKTSLPDAAPGPAGSPFTRGVAPVSALGSMMGCSSSSSCFGSRRWTAVAWLMSFSSSMSIAMLSAAVPVRLPTRHCSIQSLPSWIVNSMSSMSVKCFSSFVRMASSAL